MDETNQPKVFANKVIRQIVTHTLAEDMIINAEDYMLIRVMFRKCGGSWGQLGLGDVQQVELLKTIITTWGQMPGRKKESDQLV